jgi:hypothetical protein
VLLPPPVAVPIAAKRSRFVRPAAIAASLIFVAWMVVHQQRSLDAGESVGELTLAPKVPLTPHTIAATYRPAASLASLDSVVVHAKLYSERRLFSPATVDYVLRRNAQQFVGDIALPEDAGLSSFTIASPDGRHVDDNDGRAWEIVARDSANRPTFDGLHVQYAVHGNDDWERSLAAAKEMVRLYPDRPAGVRALFGASRELVGARAIDSLAAAFRPRVAELHRRYANVALDATTMWELTMLANGVRDTATSNYWLRRMEKEYPNDAGTIQLRVFAAFNLPVTDVERLGKLEALWKETGGQSVQLLANAFELATKIGDEAAIARWGDRQSAFPGWSAAPAATYVRYSGLRGKGEDLLRASLKALKPVERTDWQTALRDPSRLDMRAPGQWQLMALGDALLLDGRPAAALDTLRRAATLAWNPATIARLGDAALAAGDTAEAARAYAWAVADRRTPAPRADSMRTRLGARAKSAEVDASIGEAKRILQGMALASTYRRRVANDDATFSTESGARRTLKDALPPGISIVAVVSLNCGPSRADMSKLEQLRVQAAAAGVSLIAFVEDTPRDATRGELASLGYTGNISFDDRNEVSRALRQYGTPQYFIIDNGVIRADSRRAADLIGVLDAVRGT